MNIMPSSQDYNELQDDRAQLLMERDELRALVEERDEAVATLTDELAHIDAVLARRPAMDLSTRAANIEKAIMVASRADRADAERDKAREQVATVEAERDALRAQVQALAAMRANNIQLTNEFAAMLDWLEHMATRPGGLLLHSEKQPTGRTGLGLGNTGRTLREAVAQAMSNSLDNPAPKRPY